MPTPYTRHSLDTPDIRQGAVLYLPWENKIKAELERRAVPPEQHLRGWKTKHSKYGWRENGSNNFPRVPPNFYGHPMIVLSDGICKDGCIVFCCTTTFGQTALQKKIEEDKDFDPLAYLPIEPSAPHPNRDYPTLRYADGVHADKAAYVNVGAIYKIHFRAASRWYRPDSNDDRPWDLDRPSLISLLIKVEELTTWHPWLNKPGTVCCNGGTISREDLAAARSAHHDSGNITVPAPTASQSATSSDDMALAESKSEDALLNELHRLADVIRISEISHKNNHADTRSKAKKQHYLQANLSRELVVQHEESLSAVQHQVDEAQINQKKLEDELNGCRIIIEDLQQKLQLTESALSREAGQRADLQRKNQDLSTRLQAAESRAAPVENPVRVRDTVVSGFMESWNRYMSNW